MKPITDYCTVSTPIDNGSEMLAAISHVCFQLDGSQTVPNGLRVDRHGLVSMRLRPQSGVAVVSTSGHVLARLRAAELLFDYCGAIASAAPYHVTHLDVARDESVDAPSQLAWLYPRLRASGVSLTRKLIPGPDITQMLSRGRDGRDTGSIMIGDRRRAETTAIIYDRSHDAWRKGKDDPGKLLRTEIRTGVPGLSLRDVYDPEPLFYHFASPDLCDKPAGVPGWQPWGERFDIDRPQADPDLKLKRLVDRSTDLDRMLELADAMSGDGLHQLERMLARRIAVHRETVRFGAARRELCDSGQLQ